MKEIQIPALGESITEATILKWHKKPGDTVRMDQLVLEIETEKVTMEICSPCDGVLSAIIKGEGQNVLVGQAVGQITQSLEQNITQKIQINQPVDQVNNPPSSDALPSSVALKGGIVQESVPKDLAPLNPNIERVKMSRLRKTIATRLKEAQNTAAILTTFNEVDMSGIMSLRQQLKDEFEKAHNIKLGLMSFFIKASVMSLQEFPAINAQIDGEYIVYQNYYDIGVAIGSPNGLVVPVVSGAQSLSFAQIEQQISELSQKAKDSSLAMADLSGATFSISNGGTYGSLLSTPIINPPQSAILGMHTIQKRPMVIDDQILIRPMMYLALSYDHRLIDGKEAVSFLKCLKNSLEKPERLLFDI